MGKLLLEGGIKGGIGGLSFHGGVLFADEERTDHTKGGKELCEKGVQGLLGGGTRHALAHHVHGVLIVMGWKQCGFVSLGCGLIGELEGCAFELRCEPCSKGGEREHTL